MPKIKLAQYWTAACGGCDVAVLDLADRILKVAEIADLVLWPIALDFKEHHVQSLADREIDVCLFNGAIRNSENEHMARLLRRKSKTLVAFGSCAHLGGIPGLANLSTRADLLDYVYKKTISTDNPEGIIPGGTYRCPSGEIGLPEFYAHVRTLDQVVDVDYYLPGCPPVVEQVWGAVQAIATGKLPPRGAVIGAGTQALCEECPREKTEKRIKQFRSIAGFVPDTKLCLLEQGVVCCGPATRLGCGASCIQANLPCRGCYGPLPGVVDNGARLISAIAAVIDADHPAEIEKIVAELDDPAGTFYRFSLPSALLKGACQKVSS